VLTTTTITRVAMVVLELSSFVGKAD
jgi:hypothetical protein